MTTRRALIEAAIADTNGAETVDAIMALAPTAPTPQSTANASA